MSEAAFNTLQLAVELAGVDLPSRKGVFLNARYHPDYAHLMAEQTFYPYAAGFEAMGQDAAPFMPLPAGAFDLALILSPKNMTEARYLMARAIVALGEGGVLIAAAENKAGGPRLQKMAESFGFAAVEAMSKNKARSIWAIKGDVDDAALQKALSEGGMQDMDGGNGRTYRTQAGVFGWDKIDKGSAILAQHLPEGLKGKGADFGCGYGYLADQALAQHPKIKRMTCLDADFRAVELCRENLAQHEACEKTFVWADLTAPGKDLVNLDFILMNPPFHEGKKEDAGVGRAFIESAYASLRRGGALYMVANAHLPYERALNERFFSCEKLHEGQGFKVYKALR